MSLDIDLVAKVMRSICQWLRKNSFAKFSQTKGEPEGPCVAMRFPARASQTSLYRLRICKIRNFSGGSVWAQNNASDKSNAPPQL